MSAQVSENLRTRPAFRCISPSPWRQRQHFLSAGSARPGGVENGEQKVNDTFSILPPPRHLDRREKEGRRDLIAVVGCEVIDSHPLLLVQPTLVSGGGKKGRKRRRRRLRGLMMMILLPSWERPPSSFNCHNTQPPPGALVHFEWKRGEEADGEKKFQVISLFRFFMVLIRACPSPV